jgi:hypothetical protein
VNGRAGTQISRQMLRPSLAISNVPVVIKG